MSLFIQRNYLQEQSTSEIIKNAFSIYNDHFRPLFFAYFLLMFPTYLFCFFGVGTLLVLGEPTYFMWGLVGAVTLVLFMGLVAAAVITVLVSNICLGEPTQLLQAYRRLSLRLLGKLLLTYLLSYLIISIYVGAAVFAALVVGQKLSGWPYAACMGLLVLIWLGLLVWMLFCPIIVMLENRWGFRAIKRSVSLGNGSHLRNFVVTILMFCLTGLASYIVSSVLGLVLVGPLMPLAFLLSYAVSFLVAPLGSIYLVLLYYDMRVRKEGYDNEALAEDLRH